MAIKKTIFLFIFISNLTATLFSQSNSTYENRRTNLMNSMNGGVAVIHASNRRASLNNNFYYLTGKTDLSMVLVLCSGSEPKSMLFAQNNNNYALPLSDLPQKLSTLISEKTYLWVSFENSDKLNETLTIVAGKKEQKNIDYLIYKLREFKDENEQEIISKSANITADAYLAIIKQLKPGISEQFIIDTFKQKQLELGAENTSFIQAGSGANGTQIHAEPTDKIIEAQDLVVFDVGAWYNKYTSDISRTFPASGKFTNSQKEIYELVLKAQKAGIEKMVPGQIMLDVQKTVENVLLEGLLKLGLITDINSAWQRNLYLVHGYYHYIGLDIHDCYTYLSRETSTKKYEPGMIMTMEPGLYFPASLLDKKPLAAHAITEDEFDEFIKQTRTNFERYINIGVRIEDDILITKTGNIILSNAVPKEIEAIEEMMK